MNLAVVDGSELVRTDRPPDEPFQAGSVSKPVAAYAALRLVESGRLELDENVNERLVVQAGTMSRPILERRGFRTVCEARVFLDESGA